MGLILSLLRVVPLWAWALAAVMTWGAWQRHAAGSALAEVAHQREAIAEQREQALQASITETQRRLRAQEEVTDEAQARSRRAGVDAARARDAADRLRAQLAAGRASAAAGNTAAAGASEADRLADALGRCGTEYQRVAGIADAAIIAGRTCESAYVSLIR